MGRVGDECLILIDFWEVHIVITWDINSYLSSMQEERFKDFS